MPDHEHGGPGLFRESHEERGRLPDLADATRRALERVRIHRLNGVEDQAFRGQCTGRIQHGLEPGFAENVYRAGVFVEPAGAEPELLG
jgi:hypothetical protein